MRRVENEGNKRAFWGERTVGSRAMSMGASHNAGGRVSVRRNIESLGSVVFVNDPASTQEPLSPVLDAAAIHLAARSLTSKLDPFSIAGLLPPSMKPWSTGGSPSPAPNGRCIRTVSIQ